jgi:hypothetical protein
MSQHKNTAKVIFVVLDLTALAGMVGYVFVVFLGFWAGVAVGVAFWAAIGWPLLADLGRQLRNSVALVVGAACRGCRRGLADANPEAPTRQD